MNIKKTLRKIYTSGNLEKVLMGPERYTGLDFFDTIILLWNARKSEKIADEFYNEKYYRIAARIYLISEYLLNNSIQNNSKKRTKLKNKIINCGIPIKEISASLPEKVNEIMKKPIDEDNFKDILETLKEQYTTNPNLLKQNYTPGKGL